MKKIRKYRKFMKDESRWGWLDECKQNQIYMISIIQQRGENFKVEWDILSLELEYEESIKKEDLSNIRLCMSNIIYKIIDKLDLKEKKKIENDSNMTPFWGHVGKLPEKLATKIAEELSIYLNGLYTNYSKNKDKL